MDAQLKELIELQKEQNQLLKKYLWRFRFSLLTLLVLTTGICICLGVMMHSSKTSVRIAPASPWSTPSGVTYVVPSNPGNPRYIAPSSPYTASATPAGAIPFPTSQAAGNNNSVVQ
jgi:hypothetical protein